MTDYFRPIVSYGLRPGYAVPLAGGPLWFTHAEHLRANGTQGIIDAQRVPADWLTRLSAPRSDIAGLSMRVPSVMGILNVTPDSFSDGGQFSTVEIAASHAQQMIADGVHLIDVGGESTRPGAETVPEDEEIRRIAPVIAAIRKESDIVISLDTRKAAVATAGLQNGATIINDVSGFTYDPDLASVAAASGAPVCVMHAQGDPKTMQAAPHYNNVLTEVYDFLSARVDALQRSGISPSRIIADIGIGFGKTQQHNLALLRGISLFHGLGVPILLGVSRKKFIGDIGGAPIAKDRMAGSVAVGLAALGQGVQILRVHDVKETAQAVRLWQSVTVGDLG